MPQLSLIVPVYNVEGYVRECLTSILDQNVDDIEVIAIDDASTDNSAAIVESIARQDDRVRFIRLERNGGLGNARNEGLDVATGDYIMFVDSDDWLAEHSLEAILERIAETDPDVLVFDYARSNALGKVRRNARQEILRFDATDVFDLHAHPDLLNLLMVVWNKVYRREFTEGLGLRFPDGYYEDLPWTYPVLVAAKRISILQRVCYYYRQRRHGNILRTSSRQHFEVFGQYDLVFAFLDQHPELEEWRPVLAHRMGEHLLAILGKGEQRIPPQHRREFFSVASRQLRNHAEGLTLPAQQTLEQRLLRRGSFVAFEANRMLRRLSAVARRPAHARHTLRRRAAGFLGRARRALYVLFRRLPMDPNLAVFAAYWYRGYSCNPRAIYEKMRELAPQVAGVWVVSDAAAASLPKNVDYVLPGTLRYYWVLARAKFFINNANFGGDWVKRKGSLHLMSHHGTPLKTMGVDLKKYPVPARQMQFGVFLARIDRCDFSLSSNRLSTEVWGRANPANYAHLEYGYPRNDLFHTASVEDQEGVRRQLGIPDDKITVLYAPTFRDWEDEFEMHLDLPRLCGALGDDHLLMVRSHYFHPDVAELRRLQEAGELIDVTAFPDVQELCLAADILLTDYSSIQFDYANLARPIVIYADDWDLYRKLRGTYFDLLAEPPGAVARDEDELIEVFTSRAYESPEARERLLRFRERFCEFDDGRAAERVVRRMILGEDVTHLLPSGAPPLPAVAPDPPGSVSRARVRAEQSA